ncbi:glycogen synthase [Haloferula chungangensis]|uniref:starch synthase n=1 Tax=Haloferula chungangensis TaxID=1048331 RepID=A0ABW2L475_9BACT
MPNDPPDVKTLIDNQQIKIPAKRTKDRPGMIASVGSLPSQKPGSKRKRLKVLLVTPEISESSFLATNGKHAPCVKAGGLADVSALLLDSLSDAGADVHLALPHFRSLFEPGPKGHSRRLHLCKDREFFYRKSVYDGCQHSNLRASLAFQRDVIMYVIPKIRPDIVHCHDWMTGLIPAAARSMGISSIFTMHNLHDETTTLAEIEDRGIDSATFWSHLYYGHYPHSYEETRNHNSLSMLGSGILAADRINTVSPSFLSELADGGHNTPWQVADAVKGKIGAGHAAGILNSLPDRCSPRKDRFIYRQYHASSHIAGKGENKVELQRILGLDQNPEAPLLFWPSRLDPMQKGCQLLAEILQQVVSDYWDSGLQVVFVADGPFARHFENIIKIGGLHRRVGIRSFHEPISCLGYAASDFLLMPSSFEPCGLAQMIGLRYGSLPIAHRTGGLRDTIQSLDATNQKGNGFLFEVHDSGGLRWAIDRAMEFHQLPEEIRFANRCRIMNEADQAFSPRKMIAEYLNLYRSLIPLHAPSR